MKILANLFTNLGRRPLILGFVAFGALLLFFYIIMSASTVSLRHAVPSYREITPTVHEWTVGPLRIIDIRTGTEINRIILGPGDRMIAERIYVNWEGEQEVRRIGMNAD